jgi:hypothetical protein
VEDPTIVSYSLAGAAALLLGFLFRTLWRQDGSWKMLLDEERASAAVARSEAESAKDESRKASAEAAGARAEAAAAIAMAADAKVRAAKAELATEHCERDHAETRAQLDALRARLIALGIPLDG